MTQISDIPTTIGPAEVPPVEPTDILPYLARSAARDLDVLAFATADGVPGTIHAAQQDAAGGINSLIDALMAEGLTVEEAQCRAAALIAEQSGEVW
jgi:hypothetical protein